MEKFVFFLVRKDSRWNEEEKEKILFFAVIIKTLVPVLKRAKQRTFRGDRDEEREREQPSVQSLGGCEAPVECFKAQRFLLRANVSYETRPAVHTNTHLVECKRTMCFCFVFLFFSRRCCSRIKTPTDTDASQIVAVVRRETHAVFVLLEHVASIVSPSLLPTLCASPLSSLKMALLKPRHK